MHDTKPVVGQGTWAVVPRGQGATQSEDRKDDAIRARPGFCQAGPQWIVCLHAEWPEPNCSIAPSDHRQAPGIVVEADLNPPGAGRGIVWDKEPVTIDDLTAPVRGWQEAGRWSAITLCGDPPVRIEKVDEDREIAGERVIGVPDEVKRDAVTRVYRCRQGSGDQLDVVRKQRADGPVRTKRAAG